MTAHATGVNVTKKSVNLLTKDHLKPEFVKINPQHTVPVLTDDGLTLCDSHAIATYLVNAYTADDSLYPKDPKKRAIVDQFLYFDATKLFPNIRGICFPVLFLGKTTVDEQHKTGVHESLTYLDKFLEGKVWVAGDKMTIADFACVASVSSIEELGFDMSKYQNVKRWLSRCESNIPGYKELNEPGAKQLGELIRGRLEPNQI